MEGNPEYFYNFLMMGLKQYYCSTCLCEFGCCSAVHLCPFCRKSFEYTPDDYHRHITCGNAGCTKKFGFWLYSASDKVLSELKAVVLAEQQARLKATAVKQRRAQRANGRGGSAGSSGAQEEQAFMLGLTDDCPRCGVSLEQFSEELAQQHLRQCTNSQKHAQHAAKKNAHAQAVAKKQSQQDKQASVQGAAAWQFLGGNQEQLYLLDDAQLQRQASEQGVVAESGADRAELINQLASRGSTHSSSSTALVIAGTPSGDTAGTGRKRKRIDASSLPPNLHSLDVSALRELLASHGLLHLAPRSANKSDLLRLIEGEALFGEDAEKVLLIEDDKATTPRGGEAQKKKRRVIVLSDSDSDYDSE
jgi:hypothetical protein